MNLTSSPVSNPESISLFHRILFLISFLGCIFGGNVSTLMSVYLPTVVNELLGPANPERLGEVSAYINALYILGWAIGGITWGFLSDRFGRSLSVSLSIGCVGLFTMVTSVATSWPLIVAARFLTGFGVGGVLVTATTFLAEVWPVRTRSIFVGILSIGFPIGIFSAGLTNYFVAGWRMAFLIGIIPFGLAILAASILKESEVWKANRAAQNGIAIPNQLLAPENRKNMLIGTIIFGAMLIGLWAIFSWIPTWIQSMITTDAQKERGISMMMLGGGGLIGGFLSGYLSNGIGVRKSMILCFAGCFVMSFLLFRLNSTFSTLVYLEIAVLALFFGASQGTLSVYIPLLFPTTIRATATGFCFNIGRLFTASVVFFVGWLVVTLGGYGNSLFIFSWIFFAGLMAVLISPDIKSKT